MAPFLVEGDSAPLPFSSTAAHVTTIRKTNDCLIAATTLEHRCQLLHHDKDFALIAKSFPLKVVTA